MVTPVLSAPNRMFGKSLAISAVAPRLVCHQLAVKSIAWVAAVGINTWLSMTKGGAGSTPFAMRSRAVAPSRSGRRS